MSESTLIPSIETELMDPSSLQHTTAASWPRQIRTLRAGTLVDAVARKASHMYSLVPTGWEAEGAWPALVHD